MKKKTRRLLQMVLLGVFFFSTVMFLLQLRDKSQGSQDYSDARAAALRETIPAETVETEPVQTVPPTIPQSQSSEQLWYPEPIGEDENLEDLQQLDIPALQEINPDVLGWICIPGTKIDYPLLQGEDNTFYLEHTWQKNRNSVGAIFLESLNSPEFSDFNTIVYGHNMSDGSMFAYVSNYTSQWHFDNHPYIYVVLPEGILRYEVFSAYKAPVESQTYRLSFRQRQTRQDFLDATRENSAVECEIVPQVTDRILTLSTCTGRGYSDRWVVHGRLKMQKLETS